MREPLKRIKTLQQQAVGQQRLNTLAMLSSGKKKKEFIHGLPTLSPEEKYCKVHTQKRSLSIFSLSDLH